MQASQNTAQVFLGVNLKCNACHDSFVSHWKLKDAYALAGYFSPDPKLQLYRCDRALDQFVTPAFLYPELSRTPPSSSLDDRRATIAAIFTDPRNGRLPRTLVNRVWQRLFGYGLVGNPDDMDVKPWNAALLDWLAADFVSHGYDIKHLLSTIMSSRAYQLPATGRHDEPRIRDYAFAGPEIRRLTAEQFADAIGSITGEWSVYPAADAPGGVYGRAWRSVPDNLSLALGRPIRDQVTTTRVSAATTLQGLELVNGSTLTMRLARGSQRMLGVLPPDPISLFNKPIAGRAVGVEAFDVDVSKASKLWLVVQENGSSAPERIEAVWANAELVGPAGTTRLASLTPVETAGGRTGSRPIVLNGSDAPVRDGVRVASPSRVLYDIGGRGFSRFRGTVGIENADVGSTLQPQIRFFIFDQAPDMDRLVPPIAPVALPSAPKGTSAAAVVDRLFRYALARPPSADEQALAEQALVDPARPGTLSPSGLADLLWARADEAGVSADRTEDVMTSEERLVTTRLTRRQFMGATAAATVAAFVEGREPRLLAAPAPIATADAVIVLWMAGGMAQTETFDPKTLHAVRTGVQVERVLSTFPTIDTAVDHIKFTQGLERVGKVIDRGAVIRTFTGGGPGLHPALAPPVSLAHRLHPAAVDGDAALRLGRREDARPEESDHARLHRDRPEHGNRRPRAPPSRHFTPPDSSAPNTARS